MRLLLILFSLLMVSSLNAQNIFSTEIHYDNTSGDVDESIEVYVENPQPADLSLYSVVLYNGSNSQTYGLLRTLADYTATPTPGGGGVYYHYNYTANSGSLQNGAPDGWALVGPSGVIEFLSYEGTITAANGPANGMTSVDIGDSETGSAIVGTSIQNDGFGNWTSGLDESFGAENSINLPVELISFVAIKSSNTVILKWITASEINNEKFEIERSHDGKNFEKIGIENGFGSSKKTVEYTFTDRSPIGNNSYYRLKQVDFDGNFEYSKTLSVYIRNFKTTVSPTKTYDYIHITSESDVETSAYVYTANGKMVKEVNGFFDEKTVDISDLSKGIYIVRIISGSSQNSQKIIKL